jgi:hypothetical protein
VVEHADRIVVQTATAREIRGMWASPFVVVVYDVGRTLPDTPKAWKAARAEN